MTDKAELLAMCEKAMKWDLRVPDTCVDGPYVNSQIHTLIRELKRRIETGEREKALRSALSIVLPVADLSRLEHGEREQVLAAYEKEEGK